MVTGTSKQWIVNDFEGTDSSLGKISQHLIGSTGENHDAGILAEIRTEHLPNTCIFHYRYTALLDRRKLLLPSSEQKSKSSTLKMEEARSSET
jgi:hypothetical protein